MMIIAQSESVGTRCRSEGLGGAEAEGKSEGTALKSVANR